MKVEHVSYHNLNSRNNISYKDIKLTSHAILRANQRLRISSTNDLKKMASNAKKNGINIQELTPETYSKFGISEDAFKTIRRMFYINNSSTRIYLYKGVFFVFSGNHCRTLKTVVEMSYCKKEKKGRV